MKKYALQLYDSMEQDLYLCMKKDLDQEKETECCFQISNKYWQQLKTGLSIHVFKTDQEEIDFFKNIKPLFTSEIEYYNLVYHSQLFRPLIGSDETEKFWLRESCRFEKFTEANADFYKYYLNKETSFDEQYFLRRNYEPDNTEPGNAGADAKTSTSHDSFLTTIMALEKYQQYVMKQLENLSNIIKKESR